MCCVEYLKKLLELGDRYIKNCNWKDFSLLKVCLFSMGLIAGTQVPKKHKKTIIKISAVLFVVTYIPLVAKLLFIAMEKDQ